MALSFTCNRMHLHHVYSTCMFLGKFLAFNCVIFHNTNLVEIILLQSLDKFRTLEYGKFFMMNWMDSRGFGLQVGRAFPGRYVLFVVVKLTFQNL